MRASICIVTTGQPSTNPRAVKEADALTAAGYDVRMVGAHWADWADLTDAAVMASRPWTCELVEWRRAQAPIRFWHTRLRHHGARAVLGWPGLGQWALSAAVSRLTPELAARARRERADLYIAHNLGALPPAAAAARRWGAKVAFDAEDFHSGQFSEFDRSRAWRATVEAERAWIPSCDYVTAASPGIAEAYAPLCDRRPVLVRNVFPLADRPPRAPAGSSDSVLRLYWFSQTIGPGRGLEDVIRAMGQLPRGSVELHLRGTWFSSYEGELRAVAEEAGVDQSCVQTHPPAEPDELVRLASRWDIGLVLETGETPNSEVLQSNKILTYLLAGVPFLSSDTMGHQELAERAPGAGWLFRRGDVGALAGILARLLGHRAEVREAAARAWELGEAQFNWDREQHVFLGEVERVLGSVSGSRA